MHSRPKLLLAVLTSPGAAFQEILERNLLGTGILVTSLAGAAAMLVPFAFVASQGSVQLFLLGKNNPICWLGVCMLYAFVLSKLLKWIGSEIEFAHVLTIMGWSQILLLLSHVVTAAATYSIAAGMASRTLLNLSLAAQMGLPIWYMVAIGIGIRTATGAPLSRGIITYVAVAMVGGIGFSMTYSNVMLAPFQSAPIGIRDAAQTVVGVDQSPWLATGVIGLMVGLWQIGRRMQWEAQRIATCVLAAAAIGGAALAAYVGTVWSGSSYYNRLAHSYRLYQKAQRTYDNNRAEWSADAPLARSAARLCGEAAALLASTRAAIKGDSAVMVDLGTGDLHYLAGQNRSALARYRRVLGMAGGSDAPKGEARPARAHIHSRIGAAYYALADYKQAVDSFRKAAREWKDFRDPWVRLAITHARTGEWKKAVEAGNHAIKTLDSEAVTAWIALAQAFANIGDVNQAKAAIAMVAAKDKGLAARLGDSPEDYADAVAKLTSEDLKFPLEREPAKPPKQAGQANGKQTR